MLDRIIKQGYTLEKCINPECVYYQCDVIKPGHIHITVKAESMHDPVNHPKHYTQHPSGVECIEIVRYLDFNLGNAFKYIFRRNDKDDLKTNLQKAAWYVKDELLRRTAIEIWKVWPSDNRYEVSTLGRIRCVGKQKCRKPVQLKSGYMTFIVMQNNKHVCYYIHRVVAETFLVGFNPNVDVRHKNGDRTDNCLANLLFGTAKNKVWNNSDYNGSRNPSVWLTDKEVEEIRLLKNTDSAYNIGIKFGVSRSTIQRIWNNISWQYKSPIPFYLTEKVIEHENKNISEILIGLVKASWTKNTVDLLEDTLLRIEMEIRNAPSKQTD